MEDIIRTERSVSINAGGYQTAQADIRVFIDREKYDRERQHLIEKAIDRFFDEVNEIIGCS